MLIFLMPPSHPNSSILTNKYCFYVEQATTVFRSSSDFHTETRPKPAQTNPASPGSPSQILYLRIVRDMFLDRPSMLAHPRPKQAPTSSGSPGPSTATQAQTRSSQAKPAQAQPKPSPGPALAQPRLSQAIKIIEIHLSHVQ